MGDGMFLVTLSQPLAWLAGQTQITGNKLLDKLTPDDTTAVPVAAPACRAAATDCHCVVMYMSAGPALMISIIMMSHLPLYHLAGPYCQN